MDSWGSLESDVGVCGKAEQDCRWPLLCLSPQVAVTAGLPLPSAQRVSSEKLLHEVERGIGLPAKTS